MDFDGDGEVDSCVRMFAEEMLCTSKEEHEALFGDAGDFDDDMEDDFEIDAVAFKGTKSFICLTEEYTKGKKTYGNAIVTNVGIEDASILIEAETAMGGWKKKE